MNTRIAISAAVLVLGLAGADAAYAQAVYVGPRLYDPALRPYEVMSIVRSAGLAPLTRPMRRGPTYVVVAADRAGGQMRVVVDAFRGSILAAHSMTVPGPYVARPGQVYGAPRYGALPGPYHGQDGIVGAPPVLDQNPNARPANPNPAIASVQPVEPARPKPLPLPRPRPDLAKNGTQADKPTGSVPPAQSPQTATPAQSTPATPAKPAVAPVKPDTSEAHPMLE